MTEDNDRIAAATAIVKAAFEPNATAAEMEQGEHVLSSLLTALRGAMEAKPQTSSASSEPPPRPMEPSDVAPAGSQMLDTIIHFLKDQLDDEDRATIESQAAPFSVPFIH